MRDKFWYIIGPPGTGKTATIAKQARNAAEKYGNDRVVVCSLTRAAAREASRRVPIPRKNVGTLHALCYHALSNPKIAEANVASWNEQYPSLSIEPQGKDKGLDSPQELLPHLARGDALLSALSRERMMATPPRVWSPELQHFHTLWSDWKGQNDYCDFTDLIELAIQHVPTLPQKPAVLFLDEAQDSAKLELQLLLKWAEAPSLEHIVIVGDEWQCLYEWRGSLPGAIFPADCNPKTNPRVRVLSQSYRVPAAVHCEAIKLAKRLSTYQPIHYEPRNVEGMVTQGLSTYKDPHILNELVHNVYTTPHDGKRPGLMIMAACAYMLEPTIRWLRETGTPFSNPWRPSAGKWNPLSTRGVTMSKRLMSLLRPWREAHGANAAFWTATDLQQWIAPMQAKGILARGAKAQIESLDEATPSESLAKEFPHWFLPETLASMPSPSSTNASDMISWWANKLLSGNADKLKFPLQVIKKKGFAALDERPRVVLGTIHSFKGAEADNVVIYPDLSPIGFQSYLYGNKDPLIRQYYVALTRAYLAAHVCSPVNSMTFDF